MCGIAGFTSSTGNPDESLIRRMTATIVHRGPDQQGVYSSSGVALGAVRLQVIDLDGGEQPVRSGLETDEHQTVIVYNGEIYNFRELRGELEGLGHRFHSDCDTEVALRAFIQWDTGCFERLRGMFAMAIWSERDRRLVLARDRLGIKPLYIRRVGDDLVFGSELKVLFEHPDVTRHLDRAALSDFLSLLYVPSPRTLIEGIEKLPSGHYLEWRDGVSKVTSVLAVAVRSRRLDHGGRRAAGTRSPAAGIGSRRTGQRCASRRVVKRWHRLLDTAPLCG